MELYHKKFRHLHTLSFCYNIFMPKMRDWGFLAAAFLPLAWVGCSRESADFMPHLSLPTLAGTARTSLSSCPTRKCLTVYVAPWCPTCRAASPLIKSLRDYLFKKHIDTRIVVGMDQPSEIRKYAEKYGPQTLLDPSGDLRVDGVPHFTVSNARGDILADVSGIPAGVRNVQDLASFYGLP